MTETKHRADTYWFGKGAHQEVYDRLYRELVPASGMAETQEGELLRSASKIAHDFWNNGGGNNVSGSFLYVRCFFPEVDHELMKALEPFVTGAGPIYDRVKLSDTSDRLLDQVVRHVASKDGVYAPNDVDCMSLRVSEIGSEHPFDEPDLPDPFADEEEYDGHHFRQGRRF